jgi:hypothetical protein
MTPTQRGITNANGFRAMASLRKAAQDPRIEEIEGGGLDEGRVFVHALRGWRFRESDTISYSVGSAQDLRMALGFLVRDEEAR